MLIIVDICSYFLKAAMERRSAKIGVIQKTTLPCSCTTLAGKSLKNTCKGVHFSADVGVQLATT